MTLILYYDDTCNLCTTNAVHMKSKNPKDIIIKSVDEGLEELSKVGISRTYAMTYVCVKNKETNEILSGMNAIRLLCKIAEVKHNWLLHLPIIKQICNISYPIVAKNRYYFPNWVTRLLYGRVIKAECPKGVCNIPPHKR